MLRGWRQRLRRTLSGLLVLSVILMSAAQVNAQFAPGFNVFASETTEHVADPHAGDHVSMHEHADQPCKGHERSHGVACCLIGGCPLLTAELPATPAILSAAMFAPMSYSPLVTARLVIAGYAPDPPPPRFIV